MYMKKYTKSHIYTLEQDAYMGVLITTKSYDVMLKAKANFNITFTTQVTDITQTSINTWSGKY
jgi:hypothetical protein